VGLDFGLIKEPWPTKRITGFLLGTGGKTIAEM